MRVLSRVFLSLFLLLAATAAGRAEQGKSAVGKAALSGANKWFESGARYAAQQQNESAIDAYTRALELNPAFVEAYTARGSMYVRTGKSERALEDYNKALTLDRNNHPVYNNRGMIYLQRRDLGRAVDDFSKAIAISPTTVTYLLNRAAAYTAQKQFEKALADYTNAIGAAPDNADAYAGRGNALYKLGNTDQAVQNLRKACSLGSETGCKSLKALGKAK